MYLRDLGASLLRRWYLVILGLILTVGACFATVKLVPPTYEAQATVLLLPPTKTVGEGGNPYLFLGALNQALDILVRTVNTDSARAPLEEQFPDVSFAAERDGTTSAPIMVIKSVGDTPNETVLALSVLLDSVPPKLAALQDPLAVPVDSRISSTNLAADDSATKDTKSQTRALVAMGAVCLTLTILLTGLLDRALASRRLRRKGDPALQVNSDLPSPSIVDQKDPYPMMVKTRTEDPPVSSAATVRSGERMRLGLDRNARGRATRPSGERHGTQTHGPLDDAVLDVDRGRHRPSAHTRS
jgi:hypothetical protein